MIMIELDKEGFDAVINFHAMIWSLDELNYNPTEVLWDDIIWHLEMMK